MRGIVSKRLDSAEQLEVGQGQLDVYAVVKPTVAAGAVDYQHRLSRSLSAWASAYAGIAKAPGGSWEPDAGAIAGLRWRF